MSFLPVLFLLSSLSTRSGSVPLAWEQLLGRWRAAAQRGAATPAGGGLRRVPCSSYGKEGHGAVLSTGIKRGKSAATMLPPRRDVHGTGVPEPGKPQLGDEPNSLRGLQTGAVGAARVGFQLDSPCLLPTAITPNQKQPRPRNARFGAHVLAPGGTAPCRKARRHLRVCFVLCAPGK